MGDALKRLNFFVEEDVRKDLEKLVPAGQKSRVINDALRRELLRIKREKVTKNLMLLRSKSPRISQGEIVETLRKERGRKV